MDSNLVCPPHYATVRVGGTAPMEDCRDFLRTGRCKYGSSCKYTHPLNVQNGGGMKGPIDPSEPLFPIRPNEPICQYYIKHGTCKFGQACKFHHPPQVPQQVQNGAGSVAMMSIARQHEIPQLFLNPMGVPDTGNAPMMVQFLPQRPDEPDCIYFLKNGRCKYGATCRYHHPLNYHQRRAEDQRRHHEQRRTQTAAHDHYHGTQIHYVQQPVSGFSQGPIYVSDSPVALLGFSDRDGIQSYQQSVAAGADGTPSYCLPVGSTVGTEQASSTASISSSYDTAMSNFDHMGVHSEGNRSSALWNRRIGSGGSLNTYGETRSLSRQILPHSASDGIISRRSRTQSHGSVSDHAVLYDSGLSNLARNDSAWRVERGLLSEHTANVHQSQYVQRADQSEQASGGPRSHPPGISPPTQPRRIVRRPPQGRTRGGDEGFSMMTSALLNMLDTPEEVSAESCNGSEDDFLLPHSSYSNDGVHPSSFRHLSLNQFGGYLNEGVLSSEVMQVGLQQEPSTATFRDPDGGLYFP
jgi:hypothetical protein